MRRAIFRIAAVMLLACGALSAQEAPAATVTSKYESVSASIAELWKAKKYRQATDILLAFYNTGEFLDLPSDQRMNVAYNLACGHSLLGLRAKAVSFLQQALAAGYRDYYHVMEDTDLDPIRRDPEFLALLAKLKSVGDYEQILRDHAGYAAQPGLDLPEFTYQGPTESELREFRRTYRLDEAAGSGDEVSRIINLMRWVHKTIRHDGNSSNPDPRNALHILDVCSGGKRGVNCRMLATVLAEAYLAMGFKSRHITCLPQYADDPDCHVIDIVYAPSLGKWLYMDPSFEAYWRNERGEILSIAEVRESIIAGRKIVLNKEANWNGEATDPAWYLQYMSKNLYRFSSPAASEFGYESKPNALRICLEPAGTAWKPDTWAATHTTDAERFWRLPAREN
ncbi:MAG TPA: transglutaminase domain-containing protein [Candidatus Aminicenantes bacterium]|nr:transglutaminase domain-containing protein [Candidatus Aminicenantes bacterium]HRY66234.1 transglutaminase domain-containing protein [Candidatus Aminicenantes bacterium]HRZ73148.1 transglutaminase domain-containing protein [Candidatus Aminicenantes bacterium]